MKGTRIILSKMMEGIPVVPGQSWNQLPRCLEFKVFPLTPSPSLVSGGQELFDVLWIPLLIPGLSTASLDMDIYEKKGTL